MVRKPEKHISFYGEMCPACIAFLMAIGAGTMMLGATYMGGICILASIIIGAITASPRTVKISKTGSRGRA